MINDDVQSQILLTDFMPAPEGATTKVKFNFHPGDPSRPALDLLLDDDPEWINMNKWRDTKRQGDNFDHADYLMAFAQYYPYGAEYYMFGGLYRIADIDREMNPGPGYQLELQDRYPKYFRRLIVKLDKKVGQMRGRLYSGLNGDLKPVVYELAPSTKLGVFPGYQNISMKHAELNRLIKAQEPSWKRALSYVKGVYVITDRSNGKLYVGSASGNSDGIWQRWAGYADPRNLTGGNKQLMELRDQVGAEHIAKHFQYSILEIFDTKTKQEYVPQRESYWKRVLETRRHGYNSN